MKNLLLAALFLLLSFALVGCGDDESGPNPSMDMQSDVGVDMSQPDMQTDAGTDLSEDMDGSLLCTPCEDDSECGEGNLCLNLVAEGERVCGQACDPEEENSCPESYFCATAGDTNQCVPRELTCVDRCSDAICSGTDVCDPFTGNCIRPLRLCETGCLSDAICGNGPEDICITIPGTPDTERICATGCDPEAETRECPADFQCLALDPDNAPNDGICFPIQGTCVDRCAEVDCADGQNCDPITGQCEASQFGACEPGCTNSTQCLGQDDICIDLGIGEGPHCWQSCEDGICNDGYECAALVGTSLNVCIPLGRDCSLCYDDSCFPTGICDPTSGSCQPIQADCNDVGCPTGFVCNGATTECQAIDQACSGDSWAVDCDNVETKCTTQRAGTTGVCAETCQTNADCTDGECRQTTVGSLCLPPDNGGAEACGSVQLSSSNVGRGCQPGSCRADAPVCLSAAGVTPFCSKACSSDANCGQFERCGVGPSNTNVCLPVQCECAGGAGLPSSATLALQDALTAVDLGSCSLTFEIKEFAGVGDVELLAFQSEWLERFAAYPLRSIGFRTAIIAAASTPTSSSALAAASELRGQPITPTSFPHNYPGPESKLAQAMASFITAVGGTPNLVMLQAESIQVPLAAQDIAAEMISSVADAITARSNALTAAGWTSQEIDAAFDGAPFAFLPATTAQAALAPDFSSAAVRTQYAAFPLDELTKIAADLNRAIEFAIAGAGATSSFTGFAFSMNTPAGWVVIGNAGSQTYDSTSLTGPIAILIDFGGDDVYRAPVAANQKQTGVSIAVDFGGNDTYEYVEAADPNDGILLVSDSDGRIASTVPLNQGNGPVSASNQGRQASARLGIASMWDIGQGNDTYRSLRMSQASAILGVATLRDDGGTNSFTAEAFSQGAAMMGVSILSVGGGNDTYRVWHAGQGFSTMGGMAMLHDSGGDDDYIAVPGSTGEVLYFAPTDRGVSNRNLAQGSSVGVAGQFTGGLAALVDGAGVDEYTAGTYAQSYAAYRGVAYLIDQGGADIYEARGVAQAVSEWGSGALLYDISGDDQYNPTFPRRQLGQGVGQLGSWGVLVDSGGSDTVNYIAPAGGAAIDGGFGAAIFEGGVTNHSAASNATWGLAQNAPMMPPFDSMPTFGFFADTGAASDSYVRPDLTGIGDDVVWRNPVGTIQSGYGTDR